MWTALNIVWKSIEIDRILKSYWTGNNLFKDSDRWQFYVLKTVYGGMHL
jgi:hypothetical protein